MNIFLRCKIVICLTASICAWGLAGAASASAAQKEAKPWRDGEGFRAASLLQRGVNLSNAWEAPPGTWGDRTYGKADFRAIRRAGFDHVRIPVAWHHYMDGAPAHALHGKIFEDIGALVKMARRERLVVVLTWHHFDRFTDSPDDAAVNQWHAGWRQIATHYRAVSSRGLMFELINEPRDAATTERMNALYPAVIAVVREVDARRTLIVSPGDWGSMKALPELRLPREQRNLVATGHSYEPFLFTHQGAGWTGKLNGTCGIVFPGPPSSPIRPSADAPEWVARWVADHNQKPQAENPSGPLAFVDLAEAAAKWSRREGRAVYIGEFGAVVWADAASRVRYARAMREELERHGLGWAWWDWKSNFAVAIEEPARTLRTNAALRDALIGARRAAGNMHSTRGPNK